MRSRSFLKLSVLALVAPLFVVGCATTPRSVEIPKSRIEEALAKRFPYETRVGELLVAKASEPRLTLLPDSNRLQLEFALEATDRIVHRAVRGRTVVSFGLRYESIDNTLRLADVRVDAVELQGLPDAWRRQLEPLAARVGEQLLEGTVLHTFRAEDIARANGWRPGAIRVTPTGVLVELLPPA
jgi:hypothetical protein